MSNKKVLILTHQLGLNYGGIMQAFALQSVIAEMGFQPETTYFLHESCRSRMRAHANYIVRRSLSILGSEVSDLPPNFSLQTTKYTGEFIEKNICLRSSRNLASEDLENSYYALLSGSDQVWRNRYVPVEKYLFEFVKSSSSVIRISYAASFGRDDLSEYGPKLIKKTAALAQKLNAVSVREDTGIHLVKNHWNLRAEQHVDPTLLLDADRYSQVVEADLENLKESPGQLFLYLLDRQPYKRSIASMVSDTLGLKVFEVLPPSPNSRKEFLGSLEKFQLPRVTQWLKSFMDAQFVVTDSFHGTVFSIIFKKPFFAIGNPERGLTRFTSLLSLFGLESRLISNKKEITDKLIHSEIDWSQVDTAVERERVKALSYLSMHLKKREDQML